MNGLGAALNTLDAATLAALQAGHLSAQVNEALTALARDAEARPLAYARLWHQAEPRTSQRSALQRIGQPGTVALALFGGSGTGKTEAGAQFAVAAALGRQDTTAREWCHANGIDLEVLPPGPGRILASSQTHDESRRVVRRKLKNYLPKGTTWRNELGPGVAEATLPTGGVIVCKSNDETYKGFEADEFDDAWLDEEHDREVFNAVLARLGRRGWADGHIVNTMTPLKGKTWVYEVFVADPPPGHVARWLHGRDNPFLDQQFRNLAFAGFDEATMAARERGEFVSRSGLVFFPWRRDLHGWDGEPEPHWIRFQVADWGTSVPTAILHAAYDETNDTLYVIDEVYETQLTVDQRADRLRTLGQRWGAPEARWVDPEDASTNRSLIVDHDLALEYADKAVLDGITDTNKRMAPDAIGRPHLQIHNRCRNLMSEIDGYVWKDGKDEPVKKNDHACDALRYLCRMIAHRYALLSALRAS